MTQNFSKKQKQYGFTLVELLVVIAVIGLLATIVLVSFGPVRNQARDAAIKANLSQMRLAAEVTYATNGNYTGANGRPDWLAALAAVNSACGTGCTPLENIDSTGTAWCASANMVNNTSNWSCVDSTGYIGEGTKKCVVANWECE